MLVNNPRDVASEMPEGLGDLQPSVARLEGESVIVRSDLRAPQAHPVAAPSGGGSGHEPAHAGYVGRGMNSGSCTCQIVFFIVRSPRGPS